LWEERAKNFVRENYGARREEILDSALFFGQMIEDDYHARRLHEEAMDKAIEFLEALKGEPRVVAQRPQEPAATAHSSRTRDARYGNITISGGTVVFGDGNSIHQVTVKQLVEALQKEVQEKVPESEEKRTVLKTLKQLATSETFTSVAGSMISEILRRVVSGPGPGT